jgi:hypothetical protein
MPKKKTSFKYMVSVDGTQAPKFEHDTLLEATKEAERLAEVFGNTERTIRVLRVEAVLKVKREIVTTKTWV